MPPLAGLAVETAVLTPLALGWLVLVEHGGSFTTYGPWHALALAGAGVITAVPLLLFAGALHVGFAGRVSRPNSAGTGGAPSPPLEPSLPLLPPSSGVTVPGSSSDDPHAKAASAAAERTAIPKKRTLLIARTIHPRPRSDEAV